MTALEDIFELLAYLVDHPGTGHAAAGEALKRGLSASTHKQWGARELTRLRGAGLAEQRGDDAWYATDRGTSVLSAFWRGKSTTLAPSHASLVAQLEKLGWTTKRVRVPKSTLDPTEWVTTYQLTSPPDVDVHHAPGVFFPVKTKQPGDPKP